MRVVRRLTACCGYVFACLRVFALIVFFAGKWFVLCEYYVFGYKWSKSNENLNRNLEKHKKYGGDIYVADKT